MVEIFKNWVSAMLCVGIFVTFIQLIMPKTNLRKYIYSLVGIVTVITILSPVINLIREDKLDESVSEVIANISNTEESEEINTTEYQQKTETAIRETFAQNMKNDIRYKLENKGVITNTIDIFLTEEYNVEKIRINIKKIDQGSMLASITEVVKYINQEYYIDFSKIEVIEEGE